MISLGDEVRDIVTGFKGIVTTRAEFLNGCVRCGVQPQELIKGIPIEAQSFDEEQLEIIKADKVVIAKEVKTGGPHDMLTQASILKR